MTLSVADPESNKLMDYIFPALITMLGHHKVSGFGRDNVMEIILKFVTRKDGCGWAKYFIDGGGIYHFDNLFHFILLVS